MKQSIALYNFYKTYIVNNISQAIKTKHMPSGAHAKPNHEAMIRNIEKENIQLQVQINKNSYVIEKLKELL